MTDRADHDHLEAEAQRAYEARDSYRPNGADKPADKPLAAWTLDDIHELPSPSWIVDGHIQAGTRVLLFAPSGHHKTNIAIDQSCHVAHGMPWHGHDTARHPVVIVATEDPYGAAMRVAGWHDYHGMPKGRVVVVHGGELQLNDKATIERLKATAAEHFPGETAGFLIDHYDVAVSGDPTSTEEAKAAAEGLRELGKGAAFVVLLAHCPWTTDNRAKVPVALWANVDARAKIERDTATGRATLTLLHQKNGRSGAVLRFEWEEHRFELRQGEATALIARRIYDATDEAPKPSREKLGGNERLFFDALVAAINDHGRIPPPSHDIPRDALAIPFEEWEAAAERYMPPDRDGFRWRRDFKRAVTSLRTKGRYKLAGGWCWIPKGKG